MSLHVNESIPIAFTVQPANAEISVSTNNPNIGCIENVVYFELLRRGYDVAIGKVGNAEVDFIVTKADDKLYVQVTESMVSEEVRNRELAPLQKIDDNYEKIVLSLDTGIDGSYEGIKSLNLVEWLIGKR